MMESTQRRAEHAVAPLKSAAGDLRRTKLSGAASVQELKEFLRQHRGKSSQELLGELGKSNLFQAMVKSTIGCVGLLAVLTVVPYFTQGGPQEKKSPRAAVKAESASATPVAATAPAKGTNEPDTTSGVLDGVDVDRA